MVGDPVTRITVLQDAIRELKSAAENSDILTRPTSARQDAPLPKLRSQSRASMRRTARVRLSRPAPCGLAVGNFEQPLSIVAHRGMLPNDQAHLPRRSGAESG